jgi:AbrB family looped-hinge helix DNA binding protein
VKITTKGQFTIPQDVREEFGLLPNTEVEFVRDGRGGVRLRKSAQAGTRDPVRYRTYFPRLKLICP